MLNALRVVDFKGIREIDVTLRPLTVFVGPNGVGKTTLLEAVFAAGFSIRSAEDEPRERLGGGRWAHRKLVRQGANRFQIVAATEVGAFEYKVDLNDEEAPDSLTLRASDGQEFDVVYNGQELLVSSVGRRASAEESLAIERLGHATRLRFNPEQIANPVAVTPGVPKLLQDGTGLAAFLQYLHGLRDGTLDTIEEAVRKVVPRFRRVQFRPASLHEVKTEYLTVEGQKVPRVVESDVAGVELFVEFDDGAVVSATHASEGTILALAILAVAHAPRARRLVLIDDLDRALHPSAQHRLVEALYGALKATPDLQILATTHSPDLIDACDAQDVRVLGRDASGNTYARALTEHPEAAKWLKLMRVGEFWGTVGEDWVAPAARAQP